MHYVSVDHPMISLLYIIQAKIISLSSIHLCTKVPRLPVMTAYCVQYRRSFASANCVACGRTQAVSESEPECDRVYKVLSLLPKAVKRCDKMLETAFLSQLESPPRDVRIV